MKMKEVCTRSGLTEKAVRLYCERGLVHPEKYWERGREYLIFSDHNLRELAIVSELRRAEFSLDEIALMLENPERCGDVLAGWRGRVTEQNQRLSQAKERLGDVSTHENLSAQQLAELLGAKITSHGAAPYRGETFAEFCERGPKQVSEMSEPMQRISEKQEKRERLGRLFLIFYSVIMGIVTLIDAGVSLATEQALLAALMQIVVFVVITVFLFRGATWARVVAIIRHALSALIMFAVMPRFFPGQLIGVEHVVNQDGTITAVEHYMSNEWGIVLTGGLVIAVVLDVFCVCMLWFSQGVKDYLYERRL